MNHPSLPLNAQELVDLGVGYSHVAPAPPEILYRAMKQTVGNIHQSLGRT